MSFGNMKSKMIQCEMNIVHVTLYSNIAKTIAYGIETRRDIIKKL